MTKQWDSRIVDYWAERLGVEARALTGPGTTVAFKKDTYFANRLVIYRGDGFAVVLANEHERATLEAAGVVTQADAILDGETVLRKLDSPRFHFLWRDYFYYLDPEALPAVEGNALRALTPDDAAALAALKAACPRHELDLSQISIADPLLAGYFDGGQLIGAASVLYEDSPDVADVGVLVHPAHRRSGIGAAAVRYLSRMALAEGVVVQYATQENNTGSIRVAETSGFCLFLTEEGHEVTDKTVDDDA